MNTHILEAAAVYVNAYRDGMAKRGAAVDAKTLRAHVSSMFGAVYAAVLVA